MRVWLIVAGTALIAGIVVAANAQSPAQQVQAKVQELAQAVGRRDYQTICRDVLAPALVARLRVYGAPCAQTLRVALGRVRDPVVSVGQVRVSGHRASAFTLTVASGQRASLSRIELFDTANGWRITSLDAPLSRHASALHP